MEKIIVTSIALFTIIAISPISLFAITDDSHSFGISHYNSERYNSQFCGELNNNKLNAPDLVPSMIFYNDNISSLDLESLKSDANLRNSDDWLWGDGDDQKTGVPISDGFRVFMFCSFLYLFRLFYFRKRKLS